MRANSLQDRIHQFEVGAGMRYVRMGLVLLAVTMLIVGYNWRAFRNMSCQEAMDAAQVGRNLAEGKGYSTLFIRPFSIHLVAKRNEQKGMLADSARLRSPHPDLANPPVYPMLLSALMKTRLLNYSASSSKPFWSLGGRFLRYQPDFVIAVLNQVLFCFLVLVVFLLARKLFDPAVGWLSAILLFGTELFWRFSVSGLSTILVMLIFAGLAIFVVRLEEELREPKWGGGGVYFLTALAGALVGIGALTRYSFGWLIIPLLGFVLVFGGSKRIALALLALLTFAALMAPWVVRNYKACGAPFGIAGYAILEQTAFFPDTKLPRSLDPDFSQLYLTPFWIKFMINIRGILQNDLPKLGGSWTTALFLTGLLVGFRNPAIKRLRYFLLGCLVVLVLTQAFGRTHLSDESPEINSENLLVLVAPLTLVYGVSLFFVLLEAIHLPFPPLRYLVIAVFSCLVCLPLIFTFMPPRTNPVAYPPYYPPAIQTIASWTRENELTMSDIPWAMAWYGKRQCAWLTLNAQKDFLQLYDYHKPVCVLYLTPTTLDTRFLTEWIRTGEASWGSFIFESISKQEIPMSFPLRKSPKGWMPEQLVLTDYERWTKAQ